MSLIILDMGSGNTCQNDPTKIRDMIDAVEAVDTGKHEVVLKWQLFKNAPPNTPLMQGRFDYAYFYAREKGYLTTASVFDLSSLQYLEQYKIPFVKIANNKKVWYLEGLATKPVIKSTSGETFKNDHCYYLYCISRYPALWQDYTDNFKNIEISQGVSDHTENFYLFHEYEPAVYEKHFALEHSDDNRDGGLFAATPKDLEEIL